jgi:8-oxo-dGTP pyrophosphatase MutT (NUDIX family)
MDITKIIFGTHTLSVIENEIEDKVALDSLKQMLTKPPHVITEDISVEASLKSVLAVIKDTHVYIEAAGGIVKNERGEILMIHRRGYWDLPKGKIDAGEQPEEAAVREVEEETGLNNIKLGAYIGATYHTYYMYNMYAIKKTYWYSMEANSELILVPQQEEDIELAQWMDNDKIFSILKDTYENIRNILTQYLL